MPLSYGPAAARPPAPAPLDRVQDFVNTALIMRETGEVRESLGSPAALRDWMAERDLLGEHESVRPRDLDRALKVREGIRALLINLGSGAAYTELNQVAEDLTMRFVLAAESAPRLEPTAAGAVDRLLALLLVALHEGHLAGTLPRLKACRERNCRWIFYDWSKNRSGAWCSMAACGAAAKQRHFVERRRSRQSH